MVRGTAWLLFFILPGYMYVWCACSFTEAISSNEQNHNEIAVVAHNLEITKHTNETRKKKRNKQ